MSTKQSNKKTGNRFETDLCQRLALHGFWAHNIVGNADGQPADIIACRNGMPYLIDCKVCERGKFALSRIESNQSYSMWLWEKRGNGTGWFAMQLDDGVYMLDASKLFRLKNEGCSALKEDEIRETGKAFGEWVKQCR